MGPVIIPRPWSLCGVWHRQPPTFLRGVPGPLMCTGLIIASVPAEPSFVFADVVRESPEGEDLGDDRVYFFFTEVSVEYEFVFKLMIPRIARVCKVSPPPLFSLVPALGKRTSPGLHASSEVPVSFLIFIHTTDSGVDGLLGSAFILPTGRLGDHRSTGPCVTVTGFLSSGLCS